MSASPAAMIPIAWLEEARLRLEGHIAHTPLGLGASPGLVLKWENHQTTGSFKLRGALNKVLTLQPWEQQLGLLAASAGNHGQGLAVAGRLVGAPVTVFASETAVSAKIAAMRRLGADVRLVPGGYAAAEKAGLEHARSSGATWVSPYNDGQVIAGQGTIALEILEEMPSAANSTWVVPVSGGGLLAGIAAGLKSRHPGARIVGVQSSASAFMHDLYHHGTQEHTLELPSLADGLAGAVEDGSLTIPLIRALVDDILLVEEDEIALAVRHAWVTYHERIEGSAAVTLAAFLGGKIPAPALLVISGGNIQPEVHTRIVEG